MVWKMPYQLNQSTGVYGKSAKKSVIIYFCLRPLAQLILPNIDIQALIVVHFCCNIGFQSSGEITSLKLVEKGLEQDDRALVDLVTFPVTVYASCIAARWCKGDEPLRAWVWAFGPRLGLALVGPLMIYWFPSPSISTWSRICWMAWQVQLTFFEYVFNDGKHICLSYYIYSQDNPSCSYCSVPQQDFWSSDWWNIRNAIGLVV